MSCHWLVWEIQPIKSTLTNHSLYQGEQPTYCTEMPKSHRKDWIEQNWRESTEMEHQLYHRYETSQKEFKRLENNFCTSMIIQNEPCDILPCKGKWPPDISIKMISCESITCCLERSYSIIVMKQLFICEFIWIQVHMTVATMNGNNDSECQWNIFQTLN